MAHKSRMAAFLQYRESRMENGDDAEKKLTGRGLLCAGIMLLLTVLFFVFGIIMGRMA